MTDNGSTSPAYRQTVDEVVAALGTDLPRGLTAGEARERLARHGPNELASAAAVPAWRRFAAQFQDVLVILLIIAAAISGGLWAWEQAGSLPYEAFAILAVVLLNATMGFLQESRAEAAVAALRAMSADAASAMRDGQRIGVPAAELVPGDVIFIEEGDTIPADARIVESAALQTAEAALTGESLPVPKDTPPLSEEAPLGDRENMVFAGTVSTYGHGTAVVTATGMSTEMGRIAGLLEETTGEITPLERELDRVGKVLGAVVVVIAVVMIGTIIAVEDIRELGALVEVLILGVALAVAAVPEGLPAVVTAVLSIGVQRMARRNAIVRHLAAVETLGSASVIASDKTGTLTKNEMTVRIVVTASGRAEFEGSGYSPEGAIHKEDGGEVDGDLRTEVERALRAADRANNASVREEEGRWIVQGDPTEGALLVAAHKAGLKRSELDTRLPRVGELPFSSERKLMTTVHVDSTANDQPVIFAKGAPDVLLARCTHEMIGGEARPLTEERRKEILRVNDALASEAMRTLAVAAHRLRHGELSEQDATHPDPSIENELVFAGLIGMIDPPRPEARAAVARARDAGIRPVLITGDHPLTAATIARELGIDEEGRVMAGGEIDKLSDDSLAEAVRDTSVFARVNPEHKLRLVDALKKNGAVVAMTGDGVNDAPALKKADIGIAMGITGTDVSKQAADIVLADDNFASIVEAVEEGRAIFANIRKFLRYLLSSNVGEVMTMFFGVLFASRIGLSAEGSAVVLPLLATQILWINLVTDGAPALALGVDPADEGLMAQKPRDPNERVINAQMWRGIALVGAVMAVGTLFVLDASLPGGFVASSGTLRHAQTMAFTTLMLFQVFNVFNSRSDQDSAFMRLFTNRWLWLAVAASLLLQVLVVYVPLLQRAFGTTGLSARDWALCAAVASSVLLVREITKLVTRARD